MQYVCFRATLAVVTFSVAVSVVAAQDRIVVPHSSIVNAARKEVRSSDWYPKATKHRLGKVLAAIELVERSVEQAKPAVVYAGLNEALRISDQSREWSLSRDIVREMEERFTLEDEFLTDWYLDAIQQKQSVARLAELIQLANDDILDPKLRRSLLSGEKIVRILTTKVKRSRSEFTQHWSTPKLLAMKGRMQLQSADSTKLWQGLSAILELNDLSAGIQLLSKCEDESVRVAASELLKDKQKFQAWGDLLWVLADRMDPNFYAAAAAILEAKAKDWSPTEIREAQSICFPAAQHNAGEEFATSFEAATFSDGRSDTWILPTKVSSKQNLSYSEDDDSWLASGGFKVSYPTIPVVNYVHEIEMDIREMDRYVWFKYGKFHSLRLHFENQSEGDKIKLTHRTGDGGHSTWRGTRALGFGKKIQLTVFNVCGEQFTITGERPYTRRAGQLFWLDFELQVSRGIDMTLTKSVLRPWLPGDRILFERLIQRPSLANCTIDPEFDFQIDQLKQQVESTADLSSDPKPKAPFINDYEIAMQPVAAGVFKQRETEVEISKDFWIARNEITQAQWGRAFDQNPASIQGYAHFPVDNVSYQQAIEFCQLLTAIEYKNQRLPEGYVYRLPTESEWEYVARAGAAESYSVEPEKFWYRETSGSRYHPVGTSSPNAFGVFDMHGNVNEFVFDQYHKLSGKPPVQATDPVRIPEKAGVRVVAKGGMWCSRLEHCQTGHRYQQPPGPAPYLGFRIVLAPEIHAE